MILGLSETTTGHITYEGKNINKHMYNKVGYLPEERGLHPKMTVEEELTYLATLKGLSSRDIQQRIDYWLERFAITENRKKRIQSLSKGNQQKFKSSPDSRVKCYTMFSILFLLIKIDVFS